MISVFVTAIAVTAAFLWDYHQQRRPELPLRRREWHLLRLIGTGLAGISALWFALAEAGLAGPRPLTQGTRITPTPLGPVSGPTWSEGWPAAAPFFKWLGAAGLILLGACTLGLHWPDLLRAAGKALGPRAK